MSRRLLLLDRLACAVLGLALLGGGLLLVDWRFELVSSAYAAELSTSSATDVLDSSWWPWAFAVGGVLLGLVGLAWLTAHLRRSVAGPLRLPGSGPTGRLSVDLGAVADSVAAQYSDLAPVTGAHGRVRSRGSRHVVEVTAHVAPRADVATLTRAAATCTSDLAGALPGEDVACRVLLDAARRGRGRRTDSVRVE